MAKFLKKKGQKIRLRVFSPLGLCRRVFGLCALGIWLSGLHAELSIERLLEDQVARLVIKGEKDDTWSVEFSNDLELWQGLGGAGLVVLDGSGKGELVVTLTTEAQFYRTTLSEKANSLPAPYNLFSEELTLYVDGDFMVIESSNVPNHPSPYFSRGDDRYEAYNGPNGSFRLNPNSIGSQSFVYRIPLNPAEASNKRSTNLGSIGIAINGVALFNQYAGPNNQPLTNEIDSFDQFNGHPQNTGVYHYHIEPLYLTGLEGKDGLIGVLLDGFPVYGPIENGVAVTNTELDEYHGHFHATEEFPDGIYHYHFTDTDPYLIGGGCFVNLGTQTN
jgi:hypothetical protein